MYYIYQFCYMCRVIRWCMLLLCTVKTGMHNSGSGNWWMLPRSLYITNVTHKNIVIFHRLRTKYNIDINTKISLSGSAPQIPYFNLSIIYNHYYYLFSFGDDSSCECKYYNKIFVSILHIAYIQSVCLQNKNVSYRYIWIKKKSMLSNMLFHLIRQL